MSRWRGGGCLNNRHYDPTTGVFISVDPLVTLTGQPYIYANANPVRFSDPTGLVFECPPGDVDPECGGLVQHAAANDRRVSPASIQQHLDQCQGAWGACKREQESGQIYSDPNRFLAFNALRGFLGAGQFQERGGDNGSLVGMREGEGFNTAVLSGWTGSGLGFVTHDVAFTGCPSGCQAAIAIALTVGSFTPCFALCAAGAFGVSVYSAIDTCGGGGSDFDCGIAVGAAGLAGLGAFAQVGSKAALGLSASSGRGAQGLAGWSSARPGTARGWLVGWGATGVHGVGVSSGNASVILGQTSAGTGVAGIYI